MVRIEGPKCPHSVYEYSRIPGHPASDVSQSRFHFFQVFFPYVVKPFSLEAVLCLFMPWSSDNANIFDHQSRVQTIMLRSCEPAARLSARKRWVDLRRRGCSYLSWTTDLNFHPQSCSSEIPLARRWTLESPAKPPPRSKRGTQWVLFP